MRRFFVLGVLLIPNSYASPCVGDEVPMAYCLLPGDVKRRASICTDKLGNLYYRFTRNGKTELKVNFNRNHKLRRWVDKATYTTYFGFSKGEYSYVIGVPEEKPNARAFLEVTKKSKIIFTQNCVENFFGEKHIKNNFIEDVPDDYVRKNNFAFP